MTPLVVIVAGLAAIAAGSILLRSYGPRMRVGRLLAVTPHVSVVDARALAASGGAPRYVRVDGRLDADAEFPDENHRPLVLRRRRLEARHGAGWRTLDEQRDAVPFRVREGLDEIDVDEAALDVGLVTLVREAVGTAAEAGALPDGLPEPLPGDTIVRLRIEQLSTVEHAAVLGVPVLGGDGRPLLTAGTGRPLVVCTLEQDEAMRVIAGGRRTRPVAAAAALVGGLALLGVGMAWALVAGGLG